MFAALWTRRLAVDAAGVGVVGADFAAVGGVVIVRERLASSSSRSILAELSAALFKSGHVVDDAAGVQVVGVNFEAVWSVEAVRDSISC